jgi:hypothetical protein
MRIDKPHSLKVEDLKSRIDEFVSKLTHMEISGGVTISKISKTWQIDTMLFSFHAAKGFFGSTITGKILATDSHLIFDLNVPPFLAALINEENLKRSVGQKIDELIFNKN